MGALAFILLITFSLSRVLLNVPSEIATAVALMMAMNILIVCSLLAVRKNLRVPEVGLAGIIALIPILLGSAVATGVVQVKGGDKKEGGAGVTVQISASSLHFDKSTLKVPAGQPFQLQFNNKDPIPHNVAILKSEGSAEAFARAPILTGPKSETARIKPIPAGTYYFQCDVHPTMNGQVTAA